MKNPTVKYGIIMGVVLIAYYLILLIIDKNLLFAFSLSFFVPLGIKIILMLRSGLEVRNSSEDGTMNYGEAVKATFIPWVIGSFIFVVFNYLLFNYIDPSLIDVMKEQALETAKTVAGMLGEKELDESELQEALDNQNMQVGLGSSIIDFISSLLGGIIIALLISIFIKREH